MIRSKDKGQKFVNKMSVVVLLGTVFSSKKILKFLVNNTITQDEKNFFA